jgi:hypothetical protein
VPIEQVAQFEKALTAARSVKPTLLIIPRCHSACSWNCRSPSSWRRAGRRHS